MISHIKDYTDLSFIYFFADIAFVDRADIKAYVGPPTLQARYEILKSCLQELMRTGILTSLQVHRVLNLVLLSLQTRR